MEMLRLLKEYRTKRADKRKFVVEENETMYNKSKIPHSEALLNY